MADIGTTFNAPFTDPVGSFIGNAPAQPVALPQATPTPTPKPTPQPQAKAPQGMVGEAQQFYQDILPKYQKAEEGERALELGAKEAGFKGEMEKGVQYAKANKQYLQDTLGSDAYKNLESTVSELSKNAEFRPTQENAKDLSLIFTLISLVGFGIGRGAKGNAQAALSAMNGMLEGHQQGREDLYKREKDTFETNFKALQNKITVLQEAYKRVQEIAATDKKTAEIEADQIPNRYGAEFLKDWQRKFGTEMTVKQLDKYAEAFKTILELRQKEQERAMQGMTIMQGPEGWYVVYPATGQAKPIAGSQGLSKAGKYSTESELVQQFTGVMPSPQEAKEITTVAGAMGEAYALANIARTMPDVVGRSGQLQSLVDKYVKSFSGAGDLPTANDESGLSQEALIFAKRYAAYLVGYERSLSGSARAFTVQLQKRFNTLMAQEQFTPEGLSNLLIDHTRELANTAAEKGKAFNIDNMSKMAIDINSRTGDSNAIYGYQYALQKRGAAGQTSQVPTFATEAEAEQAAKEGKIQKGTKIIIGGQSGTWQ